MLIGRIAHVEPRIKVCPIRVSTLQTLPCTRYVSSFIRSASMVMLGGSAGDDDGDAGGDCLTGRISTETAARWTRGGSSRSKSEKSSSRRRVQSSLSQVSTIWAENGMGKSRPAMAIQTRARKQTTRYESCLWGGEQRTIMQSKHPQTPEGVRISEKRFGGKDTVVLNGSNGATG